MGEHVGVATLYRPIAVSAKAKTAESTYRRAIEGFLASFAISVVGILVFAVAPVLALVFALLAFGLYVSALRHVVKG